MSARGPAGGAPAPWSLAPGWTLFAVWTVGQIARDRTLVTAWAFYLPSAIVLGALVLLAIGAVLRRRWRRAGLWLALALLPAAALLLLENRWQPPSGPVPGAKAGAGPADLRVVAWNAADFPRGVELAGNQVVEFLARGDLGIPPDAPTFRLERGNQRRDTCLVLPGIGDKDVGQR